MYRNAFFGAGTGPIYLNYVYCTLSARQLLECSSRPILTDNCDHRTDAGVGCEGKILSLFLKKEKKSKQNNSWSVVYYHCSSM